MQERIYQESIKGIQNKNNKKEGKLQKAKMLKDNTEDSETSDDKSVCVVFMELFGNSIQRMFG